MRAWVVAFMLLTGCLARSKSVEMPDGLKALRIECNYTIDNCLREARKLCEGGYDEVASRGNASCHDCGVDVDNPKQWSYARPDDAPDPQNNVWKGVLYVRCR